MTVLVLVPYTCAPDKRHPGSRGASRGFSRLIGGILGARLETDRATPARRLPSPCSSNRLILSGSFAFVTLALGPGYLPRNRPSRSKPLSIIPLRLSNSNSEATKRRFHSTMSCGNSFAASLVTAVPLSARIEWRSNSLAHCGNNRVTFSSRLNTSASSKLIF